MQNKLTFSLLFLSSMVSASSWIPTNKDNWDIQLSSTPTSLYDSKGIKLNWIEVDMNIK